MAGPHIFLNMAVVSANRFLLQGLTVYHVNFLILYIVIYNWTLKDEQHFGKKNRYMETTMSTLRVQKKLGIKCQKKDLSSFF